MARICWTTAEKLALAKAYWQLRKSTGCGRLFALQQAQEQVLPAARRRHSIPSMTQVPWLEAMVEEWKTQPPAAAPESAPPPPSIAPSSGVWAMLGPALRAQLITELTHIAKAVWLNLQQDPDLRIPGPSAVPTPDPLPAGEPEAAKLKPREAELFWAVPPIAASASNTAPNQPRLRRVVVAGLLPGQAKSMEREFATLLDVRCWPKDGSHSDLRAALVHADAALGMTDFLSHSDDRVLASQAGARYHRVSGGLTKLRAQLATLAMR